MREQEVGFTLAINRVEMHPQRRTAPGGEFGTNRFAGADERPQIDLFWNRCLAQQLDHRWHHEKIPHPVFGHDREIALGVERPFRTERDTRLAEPKTLQQRHR